MGTKLRKNLFWTNKKGFFKLLKLRKIRGKNWGKQDWWFDVTNKIHTTHFEAYVVMSDNN